MTKETSAAVKNELPAALPRGAHLRLLPHLRARHAAAPHATLAQAAKAAPQRKKLP